MDISIRPLTTQSEYLECLALQEATWGGGESFREAVGPAMLLVPQKIGGITAGAFDPEGRMVGFVYGLTGIRDGRPVHWSHMLAVAEDARDHDIGRRLKEYQRHALRSAGVETMYWTYDPLVARNAYVNFMKLGVDVAEYVENIYGAGDDSTVDAVIGTDRFVVAWSLSQPHARVVPTPRPALDDAPAINLDPSSGPGERHPTVDPIIVDDPVQHVAIPGDIQAVKEREPDLAIRWRQSTRRAMQSLLSRGYTVHDFVGSRDSDTPFYRWHRTPPPEVS